MWVCCMKKPNKCKMKSIKMFKRRDALAVKDCYGQVVDLLMSESADITKIL